MVGDQSDINLWRMRRRKWPPIKHTMVIAILQWRGNSLSTPSRQDHYKTKNGHHRIVVPSIYGVQGLCQAKLTTVLKDFMGRVNPKKACNAGSLIVRLRDLIVYMTNMGISLTCLAELYVMFAIRKKEFWLDHTEIPWPNSWLGFAKEQLFKVIRK